MSVPMWNLIVKNNGSSSKLFEDLGISVPASGSINFSDLFGFEQIVISDDLRSAVASGGNIVINDGSSDLNATDGVNFLTFEHIRDVRLNHYTKTELSTPGSSVVDWGNLQNIPGGLEDTNDLNGAYEQGRTVEVDTGSVVLSAADGGYAPLQLVDQSSAPTLDLGQSQFASIGGILYMYDSTRGKFLSVQRQTFVFGRRGKSSDQYLNFYSSDHPSNNSGLRMLRNATIVGLSGNLNKSGTCDLRLRKNDNVSNIATLNITSSLGNIDTNTNIDIDVNEFLQAYVDSTPFVRSPMLVVEIAWRQ